ncbi:hypothetical protein [Methanothermococcus okinawensis]|uniref:Uncharacterized protein n=1 Tax=Methanothermococcus okinawensis (strain DSM 14208 / JCM 11175 / IH1) TaxID=647113 RepID=F8AKA9_METOI|nr:hypothetical protein [Methanothermococcus okinawensis]AEH06309.1 hypothetical protein Metok_0319 [Methanothermococcus okinawensis IH1]
MGNLHNYSTDNDNSNISNYNNNNTKNYDSDYSLLNSEEGLDINNPKNPQQSGSSIKSTKMCYDSSTQNVICEITLTDGTIITKKYNIAVLLQSKYNNGYTKGKVDGINSVDFKTITATVNNTNIITNITLTNNKSKINSYILSDNDVIKLYNNLHPVNSGLWIKIDDKEYIFPIIDRNKQPDINAAYQPAIDGSSQYEVLGKPQKKWTFDLYVDSIEKLQFLEQLEINPVCEVKFDEIETYKQTLIQNLSYSRITSFNYNVSIDLVIL